MNRFDNFLKNNNILILILLLAFSLRFYGIYFDYPGGINHVWDETYNLMQLFDIIETKNLFSSISSPYPALLTIMYIPVLAVRVLYLMLVNDLSSLADLKDFVIQNGMGSLYIIVRWYSVVFGTAAVFMIYKVFAYIYGEKRIASLTALTSTVSVIPVFLSHWGKSHSAMILFLLLALYYSLKYEKEKNSNHFFLSAFFAGCSISVHYIGLSAIIFPVLNLIFNYKEIGWKNIAKTSFIGLITILVFYGANFNGVKNMFVYVNTNYYAATNYSGLFQISLFDRLTYLFSDSWRIEPFLTSLAIVSILLGWRLFWSDKLLRYVIIGISFNYLLMITIIVGPDNVRWLAVFMSLSFPLSIAWLHHVLAGRKFKHYAVIIPLFFLIPSLSYVIKWDLIVNRNTSVEAAEWAKSSIGNDEWLYSFSDNIDMPLSYESATWNKQNNRYSTKKIEHIINNKTRGYNIAFDHGNGRFNDFGGLMTDYVLISSSHDFSKNYQLKRMELYHKLELIKSFQPRSDDATINIGDQINNPNKFFDIFHFESGGHYIDIYKIIK